MFSKILIANRGEIVVRVAQTLKQMGITTVGVYSDPDRGAVHVHALDEAYSLAGSTAAETYLRKDCLIEIARRSGAQAVHPGYGFLSENPEFAQMCADSGLVFIGPNASVMRLTGNKVAAKKALSAAGVPVVPGWSGPAGVDAGTAAVEARRVGYPLLVKAASGGGGKGMRLVKAEEEFAASWEAASREAAAAFGDGHVFLEKYVQRPRHIEVQIFGDHHGNAVHLFERECSIQRRHQKVVEETPSIALTPQLRAKITEAAVRAAKAVNYANAGTVEFLLDESGAFYFLEINTRLQVEHPVTEATLGLDLVRAQVLVAAGERLPFAQEELRPRGHAIECRIYAEDAERGFLPSIGALVRYREPRGPGIRIDSGVSEGSQVSVFYDPMLAKLICTGETRPEAIARTRWALDRFVVLGVTTNIAFLRRLMDDPQFVSGDVHTDFLGERPQLCRAERCEAPLEALIAAAVALRGPAPAAVGVGQAGSAPARGGPWSAGAWSGA